MHLAVDANGMPIKIKITSGTEADCKHALDLVGGLDAEALLADKAYDTNEIITYAQTRNIVLVIPSKSNRILKREIDEQLYKYRHLVENAFLKLKRWRGIATRYAKTTSAFSGSVACACIFQWLKVIA